MGLIDWYILRRVSALTFPTLVVIAGIVITTQLLVNVEMVTRSAGAALGFLQLSLYLVPTVVMLVLPFAVLIGAVRTLSAMNSDSELAVLEAIGRPPRATTRPVVLFAFATSLGAAAIAHTVEPIANRAMQNTLNAASADMIRSAVRAGSFVQLKRDTFVRIGRELPGGEMANIVFVDSSDATTQVIYYAKRGNLVEQDDITLFALSDGEVHRLNKQDGSLSVIAFASSAIDLMGAGGGQRAVRYGVQSYSTADLVERMNADQARGRPAARERQELHRRFTEWLYPLLFGVIAVYVAGKATTTRQSRILPVVAGGAVAVALRAAGFVTITSAGVDPTMAAASYAIPGGAIVLFLALTILGWSPKAPKRMQDLMQRIADRVARIARGRSGHAPESAAR